MSIDSQASMPASAAALIDRWGLDAFGTASGCTDSHVRAMKARDSIPPCYWPRLVAGAPEAGIADVTYEYLTLLYLRLPLAPAVQQ